MGDALNVSSHRAPKAVEQQVSGKKKRQVGLVVFPVKLKALKKENRLTKVLNE